MKNFATCALLAAASAGLPLSSARAADVGVSIAFSQPGAYGRIDIGRFPQPQLVVAQPVIIARPAARQPEPVYLWVPPGHRKDWRRHCGAYQACGVPVYFVEDGWYGEHVRPHAQDRDNRHEEGRGKDHGQGHGKDKDREKGRGHDK